MPSIYMDVQRKSSGEEELFRVDVNDAKYRNVRSILLDPSCSGSGTVQNRKTR